MALKDFHPHLKLSAFTVGLSTLSCLQQVASNPQHASAMLLPGLLAVPTALLINQLPAIKDAIFHRHRRETGQELFNHDLARLVGNAVAASIRTLAKDKDNPRRDTLMWLAGKVENDWVEKIGQRQAFVVAENHVSVTEIVDEGLIELFTKPREQFVSEPVLTPEEWEPILRAFAAGNYSLDIDAAGAEAAAYLPTNFAPAVREKLKEDAATDGKAYAAMQLDLMREIAATCRSAQERATDKPEEWKEYFGALQTEAQKAGQKLWEQMDARFDQLEEAEQARHRVTQESLAALGWTLGDVATGVVRIDENVAEILRRLDQKERLPGHIVVSDGVFFGVPDVQEGFIGRRDVLERLHSAFQGHYNAQWRQVVVGTAGLGKTAVALAYCHTYRAHYQYVLWANADSEANLETDFIKAAKHLNLYVKDTRDDRAYYVAMQRWLGDKTNYLLVLDNVEEYRDVARAFPDGASGRLLMTSRRQDAEPLGGPVVRELLVMERSEAAAFLLYRAGRDSQNAENVADAGDLALALGDLPLALEHAGAYLKWNQNVSLRTYLDDFRQRKLTLFPQPNSRDADLRATVVTAWDKDLDAVFGYAGIKGLLLNSAFLAPDDIPEAFARAYFSNNVASVAPALQLLQNYSLMRWHRSEQAYSLHRLLQEVLRTSIPEATQHGYLNTLAQRLEKLFPPPNRDTWPECERWIAHILLFAQYVNAQNLKSDKAGILLYRASLYLYQRGRYAAAIPLLKTLEEKERELGVAHLDLKQLAAHALSDDNLETARSLNNLAELYRAQGRYAEAEPLYLRSLAIYETQLGQEHPLTAISLNNLAALYHNQARYAEAEPLYLRARAIDETNSGLEHLGTAIDLNNLAGLYYAQGRYAEAEPLFIRALTIMEAQLGKEHSDTAQNLNNLAMLYRVQGRYAEAELLLMRTLAIREKQLGEEHLDTAQSLNNLALLYQDHGRYSEAEPLFVRALAIREKQLGKEHPDTANSLNNLAALYSLQSRHEEAELLYRSVVQIAERALEMVYPDMATYMNNYALLLRKMGRADEAKEYEKRAAEVQAAHKRRNAASENP